MGLFGAAKADPKKQVNEMSQLLRHLVIKFQIIASDWSVKK